MVASLPVECSTGNFTSLVSYGGAMVVPSEMVVTAGSIRIVSRDDTEVGCSVFDSGCFDSSLCSFKITDPMADHSWLGSLCDSHVCLCTAWTGWCPVSA